MEDEGIAGMLRTPESIRTLQRKLMPCGEEHRKAVYGRTVCTV